MFDPTIYDNLKVVLEGHLYDMDAERKIRIVGREDLIDIAGMGRTFRMKFVLRDGRERCKTSIMLCSGLTDFAGELRGIHAVGERPGAKLEMQLEMPAELSEKRRAVHDYVSGLWGEDWLISHERLTELSVESDPSTYDGSYRVKMISSRKIDESHIDDMEALLEHLLQNAIFINDIE
ncbi:hypothetical protein [Paenibacillus sp. PvR052]